MYDIIYVGQKDNSWTELKSKFPTAKLAPTFQDAKNKALTKMFWTVYSDVSISDDWDFSYEVDEWSTEYIHVFKNDKFYDGIALHPKTSTPSKNELEYRYFVNKKFVDLTASVPKKYDIFTVDNYEDYLNAFENSTTEMFWGIPSDVNVVDGFDFSFYIPHESTDRNSNHSWLNGENFDGINLFTKKFKAIEKEINFRFLTNKIEHDEVASTPKPFEVFQIDTYEEYEHALKTSNTEMFWASSKNLVTTDIVHTFYIDHHNRIDRCQNHAFQNKSIDDINWEGVYLCSKNQPLSKKEVEFRFPVNRKEWDIVASEVKYYDKFYVDTYEDYLNAVENTTTDMFWALSKKIEITDESVFDILFYQKHIHDTTNEYDLNANHTFINDVNGKHFRNGVWLLSKNQPLNKKEIEHRFIVNAKEWDRIVSKPKKYDKFIIETYEQYLDALDNADTDMFWAYSNNLEITDKTIFDLIFYQTDLNDKTYEYELNTNHTFIHKVNGEDHRSGVWLLSKNKPLNKKEIEHRFLVNAKEWDRIVSGPCVYDKFVIDTYEEYEQALAETKTEMFWMLSKNLKIDNNFKFDIYFTHDNKFDREHTHAFIHKVNDKELYNGVFLCSKKVPLSKKEIDFRFPVNRKEWDIVVSGMTEYDTFDVKEYSDYEKCLEKCNTEMFWMIPDYIDFDKSMVKKVYFSHDNEFDRKINHVYKNGEFHDGAVLCSTHSFITKREFDYGFITHKKEEDIVASTPKPYDVVFISYNEKNADKNYEKLLTKVPSAKRVHGVKGIHQAHIKAANMCTTPMIWIVDGDAELVDNFNFDYQVPKWEHDMVHVWHSQNPINELVYGYGGVKLLPRHKTLNMDTTSTDMTTSISDKFKSVEVVSNLTAFDTDEYSTWKSAFRECVKLARWSQQGRLHGKKGRKLQTHQEERLQIWCSQGADKSFGQAAIAGAKAGREYGYLNWNDDNAINLINDFDWLHKEFLKNYG